MTDSTRHDSPEEPLNSDDASDLGERITGERDPRNPDGLVTLDDLDDPNGSGDDLSSLIAKARRYGNARKKD